MLFVIHPAPYVLCYCKMSDSQREHLDNVLTPATYSNFRLEECNDSNLNSNNIIIIGSKCADLLQIIFYNKQKITQNKYILIARNQYLFHSHCFDNQFVIKLYYIGDILIINIIYGIST